MAQRILLNSTPQKFHLIVLSLCQRGYLAWWVDQPRSNLGEGRWFVSSFGEARGSQYTPDPSFRLSKDATSLLPTDHLPASTTRSLFLELVLCGHFSTRQQGITPSLHTSIHVCLPGTVALSICPSFPLAMVPSLPFISTPEFNFACARYALFFGGGGL